MAFLKQVLAVQGSGDGDSATITGAGNYVNVSECRGLVLCELFLDNFMLESHYLERFPVLNWRDFDEVGTTNLHGDLVEVIVTIGMGEYTPSRNGAEVKLTKLVNLDAVLSAVQNVAVQGGVPIDTSGGRVAVQVDGNQGVVVNNAIPIDTSAGAVPVSM